MQHLDKNELVSESQHSYSCASTLLVFLETVRADLNAKHNVDRIYLDLAKAFDKVPQQRLMLKLEYSQNGDRLKRRHAYSKLTKTTTNENSDMH